MGVQWVSSGWVDGRVCVVYTWVGAPKRHSSAIRRMARATKVVALGATTSIEVRGVCVCASSCVCVVVVCVCASCARR